MAPPPQVGWRVDQS